MSLIARYARISIHAAREGGDDLIVAEETKIRISIHAAREGGDFNGGWKRDFWGFQSTPPVKAAT